jgi:hypothetical protein
VSRYVARLEEENEFLRSYGATATKAAPGAGRHIPTSIPSV